MSDVLLHLQVNQDDVEGYPRMIELWFQFCMIWSICASVDESGRKKMDTFIREMEAQFPPKVCSCSESASLWVWQ